MSENAGGRRLLNATAVMASGTMISRVLGLVRAMLIAFVLGNGTLRVEIFTFAMTVPNSLYMLLAGGTLNNVLVPQIVRAVLHDEDQGRAFVDRIMTGFLIALGALTAVLTLATPAVMSIYTNASWRTEAMAEHWQSLLLMSYITMPQLFFYGVFFLIGQVLNARDRFGPMMWAPIVNNVVSITVFGVYIGIWGTQAASGETFTSQQVWLLGLGSTLGIAVQTLVLLPYLRRAGFHYRPRFDLKGTGLGRTFHMAKWMVGYVALTSLAQVVVSNLASMATPIDPVTGVATAGAGWNAYQNAYLIWILPHSLLTVSLATAMLPSASRYAAAGDTAGVAAESDRAIRLATTFLLPACLGFLVLADPIARMIFGNGSGADDYHFVSWTLLAFAVGLVPYTLQYLYLRAFYALDNTRTPFFLQIWISGANALLAVAFVLPWFSPQTVAPRLALSYSVAYFLGAFITHRALKKRLPDLSGRATWHHLRRLLLASVPAAAVAWGISWGFDRPGSRLLQVVGLALAGIAALLVFFFTAKRMNLPEATQLINVLRRKAPRSVEVELPNATRSDDTKAASPASPSTPSTPSTPTEELPQHQPTPEQEPDPDGVGVFVPVSALRPPPPPVELLEYPDPNAPTPAVGPHGTHVFAAVKVLGSRYRLDQRLAVVERIEVWRAFDEVLERPVLVHVLPDRDPRTVEALQLARRAALATDARFLRVLDVVEAEEGVSSAYLVYEYAPGHTLEKILRTGPLTAAETAWVVREIADALIPLHGRDLYHRHLNPSTILITTSGNVKILGFLVDEVLDSRQPSHLNGEAEDVRALGNLLYACLVARWPDGDRFGLIGAPHQEGHLLLPSQVRTGVAHPVDMIVDRVLSTVPHNHATKLATAQEITTQLSLVLGPSSSAHDLRLRLHPPTGRLVAAHQEAVPALSQVVPPVPTPVHARLRVAPTSDQDEPEEETQPFVAAALDNAESFTPVPPPPASARSSASPAAEESPESPQEDEPDRRRRPIIVIGLVLAVLATVIGTAQTLSGNTAAPVAVTPGPIAIRGVDDFDPRADGGSGAENPKQVKAAIDGDPKTEWRTERYRALASFGGLKPGVGLVLDLGKAVPVRAVTVTLGGDGTALDIRVPSQDAQDAPMKSESQWRTVASVKGAAGGKAVTLELQAPQTTRFLLVYLTSLPAVGGGYYRGAVAEVTVNS